MSSEYQTITLEFEDAESQECEILGVFDVDDKEYIALCPVCPEEGAEDDIYLYGYKEDEEEFELLDISDEDEFAKVAKVFEEIMDEVE